jgi:hypothetical protein
MKIIRQTLFFRQEDIDLIEKDVNAKQSYVVFANHEIGTKQIEVHLRIAETFTLEEDELDLLVDSLCPHLNDGDLDKKKEQVKAQLRRK